MQKINRREALKQTALILGYAVSASSIAAVMNGCTPTQTDNWTPKILNPAQADMVAEIAECILPKTDTPGAKEVGVQTFIDQVLDGYMAPEEVEAFLAGLDALTLRSINHHGKTFVELDPAQQNALLTEIAGEAEGTRDSFWAKMRELTMTGYFSCEKVGKEVLKYEAIPGKFVGCIPLSDTGGVAWTLS